MTICELRCVKDCQRAVLIECADQNGVQLRHSWTRKRMWQELLRSGAKAECRFTTYLTHRVVKGPCGSWCVVATKHVV
eukprot:COSAG02_NODE_4716_length_5060_cov_2.509978_2_plen_78_part_00